MEMVEASMERKTVWLCGACGRTGKTRMAVGDESCYLNSVEVYEDSIDRDTKGRVVRATAIVQLPKPVDLITEKLSI